MATPKRFGTGHSRLSIPDGESVEKGRADRVLSHAILEHFDAQQVFTDFVFRQAEKWPCKPAKAFPETQDPLRASSQSCSFGRSPFPLMIPS